MTLECWTPKWMNDETSGKWVYDNNEIVSKSIWDNHKSFGGIRPVNSASDDEIEKEQKSVFWLKEENYEWETKQKQEEEERKDKNQEIWKGEENAILKWLCEMRCDCLSLSWFYRFESFKLTPLTEWTWEMDEWMNTKNDRKSNLKIEKTIRLYPLMVIIGSTKKRFADAHTTLNLMVFPFQIRSQYGIYRPKLIWFFSI